MRNERAARPFAVEMDRYVESIVLPQAQALGDGGALAAWMEQAAAQWRKDVAGWRRHQLTPVGLERADFADAIAELLEQLAAEVIEARPPKTRH